MYFIVNGILYLRMYSISSDIQIEHSTWSMPVLNWLLSMFPLTIGYCYHLLGGGENLTVALGVSKRVHHVSPFGAEGPLGLGPLALSLAGKGRWRSWGQSRV